MIASQSEDLFKVEFKRYKSRSSNPDYSEVVDFSAFSSPNKSKLGVGDDDDDNQINPTLSTDAVLESTETAVVLLSGADSIPMITVNKRVKHVKLLEESFSLGDALVCQQKFGIKLPHYWQIFEHEDLPGFSFICDPFINKSAHSYWIRQCLEEYPQKPNQCNLDVHGQIRENPWSDLCDEMSCGKSVKETDFFKLRWVTLGYHYDWNTKLYYQDRKSDFPADLHELSRFLANCLGYPYYNAEAGIVNFYHLDSTLAGHTDHSEYDMESPLFSISFGQDAIFLIGGETKTTKPVPIFLRSGDIVVMAAKSRLAYHAVPKILPSSTDWTRIFSESFNQNVNDACAEKDQNTFDHSTWRSQYMNLTRINLNIRQVFQKGQEFPN